MRSICFDKDLPTTQGQKTAGGGTAAVSPKPPVVCDVPPRDCWRSACSTTHLLPPHHHRSPPQRKVEPSGTTTMTSPARSYLESSLLRRRQRGGGLLSPGSLVDEDCLSISSSLLSTSQPPSPSKRGGLHRAALENLASSVEDRADHADGVGDFGWEFDSFDAHQPLLLDSQQPAFVHAAAKVGRATHLGLSNLASSGGATPSDVGDGVPFTQAIPDASHVRRKAGFWQTVFNVVNLYVGLGLLSKPYAGEFALLSRRGVESMPLRACGCGSGLCSS